MANEKNLVSEQPQKEEKWNGYTLEDLRYRRAYVAARLELEKERLNHNAGAMRKGVKNSANGVVRRVTSAVPFFEYGIMAYSVGSKLFRVLGKFRRKKK